MTALTGAIERQIRSNRGLGTRHPLAHGAVVIHQGAFLVSEADGFVRPMQSTAGGGSNLTDAKFEGVAEEGCDTTGISDGVERCEVSTVGELLVPAIVDASGSGDRGATVYIEDDGDGLTVTNAAGLVAIGKIGAFNPGEGFTVTLESHIYQSL